MDDILNNVLESVQKNLKEYLIAGALMAVGFGGFYLYKNWRAEIEQASQMDFTTTFEKISSKDQEKDWKEIERSSEAGYEEHSGSKLGPYFLAMQSQALLEEGKSADALMAMANLVEQLSKSSPVYYLYKIKYALMQLSADDQEKNDKGFTELKALAQDSKNPQQDEALYYLGIYYDLRNDKDKARDTWQQLVTNFGQETLGQSPWASMVQEKLEQLG